MSQALRAAALSGALAVACLAGCAAGPAAEDLDAAVLYSAATPTMSAALPPGRVAHFVIEGFRPAGGRASTVVLAGHSVPPLYLDRPAAEVARAIASFEPELIVLDTCFGASTPLLEALADVGSRAWVVAAPYRLSEAGFVYADDFLTRSSPASRAAGVDTRPTSKLLRWRISPESIRAARADGERLRGKALRQRLKTLTPPLVRVALGEGTVLVPVTAESFR